MENDQIKSQIENAKRAFVANKERDRETSSAEMGMDNAQQHQLTAPQEKQLQEDIMTRLSGLMDEAAKSNTVPASEPIIPDYPNLDSRAKPFWAQNRVDIPPSEQFGKRQKMQEQDNPSKSEPLGTAVQPAPAELPQDSDPLTAIRQEVFNKLGDGAGQSEKIQGLAESLQQLESRTDKQQQDLTALLKLVRQLANRQAELEQEKAQPRRQRSLFGSLIFVLLALLAASAGWLYWLNPDLVMTLSATLLNNGFDFVLNLVAQFGLL